jgi:RNA polymerase II subunit A C-terminal domain phosphatase SSU72
MGLDGASDAAAQPAEDVVSDDQFKLKFCTVCASNQNRYVDFFPVLMISRAD